MNTSHNYISEWALRLSFGCMFLYSGLDLIRHPTGWYWAVRPLPLVIQNIINTSIGIDRYLQIQGAIELLFVFIFFAWFMPKIFIQIVAILVALEMAAILLFVGVSGAFRDIGLLGGACALYIMTLSKNIHGTNNISQS